MVHAASAGYKEAVHWIVDNTFPRTPAIATASAFMGWYGYRAGMTFSQGIMHRSLQSLFGNWAGTIIAPFFVPDVAPEISIYAKVGVSCATSLTLNLISKKFFGDLPVVDKAPAKKKQAPAKKEVPKEEAVAEPVEDVAPIVVLSTQEPKVMTKKPVKPKVRNECFWGLCQRPRIKSRARTTSQGRS
jgi:hypothetical protein